MLEKPHITCIGSMRFSRGRKRKYKNKITKYSNARMKENCMYEINKIKSRATLRGNIKTYSD